LNRNLETNTHTRAHDETDKLPNMLQHSRGC
jgi:hypothetical protein